MIPSPTKKEMNSRNGSGLKKWMVEVKGYKVDTEGVVEFKLDKNGFPMLEEMMDDIDEFRALEKALVKVVV